MGSALLAHLAYEPCRLCINGCQMAACRVAPPLPPCPLPPLLHPTPQVQEHVKALQARLEELETKALERAGGKALKK